MSELFMLAVGVFTGFLVGIVAGLALAKRLTPADEQ